SPASAHLPSGNRQRAAHILALVTAGAALRGHPCRAAGSPGCARNRDTAERVKSRLQEYDLHAEPLPVFALVWNRFQCYRPSRNTRWIARIAQHLRREQWEPGFEDPVAAFLKHTHRPVLC